MKQTINSLVTFSNHDIYSVENTNISADKVNLKDFEAEFVNWLKEYCNMYSDEQLQQYLNDVVRNTSMQTLFNELSIYADNFYGFAIPLNLNQMDDTINMAQSGNTIYVNSVMRSAFFSFIANQIYHSETIENENESLDCYRYNLFLLNEMCYGDFKRPVVFPNGESAFAIIKKFQGRENLLTLSADIYYSAMAFAFSHEIAHAYLKHKAEGYSLTKEIEADMNAYNMFLRFCDDVYTKKIKSNFADCMKPHVYMAPMYLLDFYYIVYYTGSFLCMYCDPVEKTFFDDIVTRKEKLFDIFYAYENGISPEEAYDLYNFYLDGVESFLRTFVASDKVGMLDKLKYDNERMSPI